MIFASELCSIFRFIYETEHFNGVAELLEILGRLVFSITLTDFEAHGAWCHTAVRDRWGCVTSKWSRFVCIRHFQGNSGSFKWRLDVEKKRGNVSNVQNLRRRCGTGLARGNIATRGKDFFPPQDCLMRFSWLRVGENEIWRLENEAGLRMRGRKGRLEGWV